jgi:hypothetical protein
VTVEPGARSRGRPEPSSRSPARVEHRERLHRHFETHGGPSFDATKFHALAGGGSSTPTIAARGDLGATQTLALAAPNTWLTGTLTANQALTVAGLAAGYLATLLLTPGAAAYTLSINGTPVPIPEAGSGVMIVAVYTRDGTNLDVQV